MRVRYDRSDVSIDAWTSIAAAAICLNIFIEAPMRRMYFGNAPGNIVIEAAKRNILQFKLARFHASR